MRGEKRKLIAIVMAIALVLVGSNFVSTNTQAATAYNANVWVNQGSTSLWSFYAAGSGTYENGTSLASGLTINMTNSTTWQGWGDLQCKTPAISVQSGQSYYIEIILNTTGATNMALKVKETSGSDESATELQNKGPTVGSDTKYSGLYTPTSNSIQVFMVGGYAATGTYNFKNVTVQLASETTSAEPTQPETEEGGFIPVADTWTTVGNFQLFYGYDNRTVSYKGTGAYNDMKVKQKGNPGGDTWCAQMGINVSNLTAGTQYDYSVVFDSDKAFTMFAQIPGETALSQIDDISVVSGENTFAGTFTAGVSPAHGDIMFFPRLAPNGTILDFKSVTVTPHSETSQQPTTTTTAAPTTTAEPGYSAATLGAWTFADAPGTSGWQYFVHANSTGSTYKGGTGMNDPLFIKYGTYVPDADYSCMARSPITTVTSGNSCTGTISITSSADIGGAGDKVVGAAVYAYNSSTGEYTWLAGASEEDTNVVADTKTTFHLNYTAPETGKVVYILTTSYTPVATLKFEATHSEQTPTPTTTTKAPTTSASDWIDVPNNTPDYTVGPWTLFAYFRDEPGSGDWGKLAYKTSGNNIGDTQIKLISHSGWFNWMQTATLSNYLSGKMTVNQSYTIDITFNASQAAEKTTDRLKVGFSDMIYYFDDIKQGDNILQIDGFTYDASANDIAFDFGEMRNDSVFTISDITITPNQDPSTTEETTQAPQPVVDPDIDLTGYQINTSSEGFRMVGQVEPTINGQSVTEFGFVYGLSKIYKPSTDSYQDTGITNDDMEVGVDNKYVVSYATTSDGIIDNQMAHSTTATYFARTMTFGKKNKAAFASKYKVRVYAKLANNQYVYSDVNDFAVFDIAEALYQGCLMNNLANHEYLYNTILTKVNENYEEVPYEYSHKIAEPGEVNS